MCVRWILILFLLLAATPALPASGSTYAKPEFGFVAQVPDGWQIYAERENDDQFIVSFGLPSVWSEVEQQDIENAVSVTAYRRDTLDELSDLVEFETQRVADILVSREEVPAEIGRAFIVVTNIRGLQYKTLTTCHFANGVGYVIAFTATEGTYDLNVDKYRRFLKDLSFESLTEESP